MILSHLIIPAAVSAGGVLIAASYAIRANNKERRKALKELERLRVEYSTASAGTPSIDIPAKALSLPSKYMRFENSEGELINSADYHIFVVKGNSMQFCGINDNDMVFVKKHFKISDITSFPVPIVIRRDTAPANETQFKIRRAWGLCNIDNCEDLVAEIVSSEDFQKKITTLQCFDGTEALLEDFRKVRLLKYKEYLKSCNGTEKRTNVVISTTFHTDIMKIRFSIHAVDDIVGIVSESFSL